MSDQTHEQICEILESVLEQFAFMFFELTPKDELPDPQSAAMKATLSYTGPHNGQISIIGTNNLCRIITSNLIGLDSDDPSIDDYSKDSLSELLNVFIGHLLTTLYGEDVLFDFGTPEVIEIDHPTWEQLRDDPATIGLLIEDVPALLQYKIDS